MSTVSLLLAACGGFLLAVLWMDLMFDVQVLRYRDRSAALPEPVLASIAAYYRRVTTTARPMGHLVGAIMATTVIASGVQVARADGSRGPALLAALLCGAPIALALLRVYPNAVRLGARSDTPLGQSGLARAICRDHLFCLAAIFGFVALQLSGATR
jgi:hypothetical protein